MSELMLRPAGDLAGLVRGGELSARELVEASLRRIDELEPMVNAFTHVAYESALAAADAIESGDPRPYAGVPIAIKDNRPVDGMPLSMGSGLFGEFVPRHDAFLVRRLRDAGFVIVGKTSMPEMGILPTTEPRRFGPTRNPWNTRPHPGRIERRCGRGGGGRDGAGGARQRRWRVDPDPGVVLRARRPEAGARPRLRWSRRRPELPRRRRRADAVGRRHRRRARRARGRRTRDATWAPPPPAAGFAALAQGDPGRLRIGLANAPPYEDAAIDPVCSQAAHDAAALLESLGHAVEEITPPWTGLDLLRDFTRAFGPLISLSTWLGGRIAGREPTPDDVEPLTWALWERSRAQDTISYLAAQGRLESVARSLVTFFEPYDAVLTPALGGRPVPIGEIDGLGADPMIKYRKSAAFTPFTAIVNVTGQPALSLPLYHGDDGLPTAVQLIGPPGARGGAARARHAARARAAVGRPLARARCGLTVLQAGREHGRELHLTGAGRGGSSGRRRSCNTAARWTPKPGRRTQARSHGCRR